MSTKRFCDLCDGELAVGDHWFNVMLRVMDDRHDPNGEDEVHQEYADFCRDCVESGKATTQLLNWYDEWRAKTSAAEVR